MGSYGNVNEDPSIGMNAYLIVYKMSIPENGNSRTTPRVVNHGSSAEDATHG